MRAWLIGACAITLAACDRSLSEPNEEARAKQVRAVELEAGGDWTGALAELSSALAVDPASAEAALASGDLLSRMGFLTRAVEMYETATGRAAGDPRGHLRLARLYRANGRAELSARSVEAAHKAAESDPDVQIEVGRLRLENDDVWGAAAVLGRAIRARPPDTEVLYLLGVLEHRRQAYTEAQAFLDRAVVSDGRHVPAILELASLLRERGRSREALGLLNRARAALGQLPSALLLEAAGVRRDLGRIEEAQALAAESVERATLERAIAARRARLWTAPEGAALRRKLSADLLLVGDAEGAEGIARGWVERAPADASAWTALARSCLARGAQLCVETACQRLIGLEGADPAELARLAEALATAGLGDSARAIQDRIDAVAAAPP